MKHQEATFKDPETHTKSFVTKEVTTTYGLRHPDMSEEDVFWLKRTTTVYRDGSERVVWSGHAGSAGFGEVVGEFHKHFDLDDMVRHAFGENRWGTPVGEIDYA
jgi:hypothetical protein